MKMNIPNRDVIKGEKDEYLTIKRLHIHLDEKNPDYIHIFEKVKDKEKRKYIDYKTIAISKKTNKKSLKMIEDIKTRSVSYSEKYMIDVPIEIEHINLDYTHKDDGWFQKLIYVMRKNPKVKTCVIYSWKATDTELMEKSLCLFITEGFVNWFEENKHTFSEPKPAPNYVNNKLKYYTRNKYPKVKTLIEKGFAKEI